MPAWSREGQNLPKRQVHAFPREGLVSARPPDIGCRQAATAKSRLYAAQGARVVGWASRANGSLSLSSVRVLTPTDTMPCFAPPVQEAARRTAFALRPCARIGVSRCSLPWRAMAETKRARRRRDLARMKAKALRVRPYRGATLAIKQAEHLAACSCWMCGNPRRFTGERTLQERLRPEDFEPELWQ